MEYKDLRNKTVFDFCDDKKILDKIVPWTTKEEHEKTCITLPYVRWSSLIEFADLTHNEEFRNAIEVEFANDIELFFNE